MQTIIETTTPKCKHEAKSRDWKNLMLPNGVTTPEDFQVFVPDACEPPLPPVVIDPKKFTLKKFDYSASLSEETNAFTADIWFDNKKIAYAKNDGHGGSTNIQPYPDMRDKLEEAEAWARSLPPESSYGRIYAAAANMEEGYASFSKQDIRDNWWFTTDSMDLETLVDTLVEKKAHRKSVRKLTSCVAFGPKQGDKDGQPVVLQYTRKPTADQIQASVRKDGRLWAVPYAEFLDLPFHYYPAPHPYASSMSMWHPKIRHIESGKVGKIDFRTTNDHQVGLAIEDEETLVGKPEEFEFMIKGE